MAFERACTAAEVQQDRAVPVTLGGIAVAVARQGDEFFAFQDVCTHGQVALSEGEVADCEIECWLHGSTFDLRTGKPTVLPATEPVSTFPVELRGDDLYIDVAAPLNGVTPS